MGKARSRKPKPSRTPVRRPVVRKPVPKVGLAGALSEYQNAVEKDGYAHVVALGDEDCSSNVRYWFSTGSLALDRLFNGRGLAGGRLTEIFGPGHIGKSTVADYVMAVCQRNGGVAVLADTESARDVVYSKHIGVKVEDLQVLEFSRGTLTVENVMDKVTLTADFWATKYPDVPVVIVWDALGGTATQDEWSKKLGAEEGEKKDNTKPGNAAKVMQHACRQLISRIAGTKIAVLICNHEYQKINTFGVGPKRETYGGEAIRRAATNRIEMFPMGWIKRSDGEVVGREVGVKMVKNRLGAPWGQARIAIIPSTGIDNTWDIFEYLKAKGVIQISGSWATMNLDGQLLKFQGWSGLQARIIEDQTLFPRLVTVYQALAAQG